MRYLSLALMSCLSFAAVTASGETTAFVNVNVLPMSSEQLLVARTVIVEDGIIRRIGAVDDTVVPDDAAVIDGTDRYLMPGLTEMHGHVTGTDDDQIRRLFGLYLANGVTTVRGMLGRPAHLELREAIRNHEVIGPRLITSGPSFNGGSVSSPAQGERMVRDQHAAGYDFLKIHPGLSRAEFAAVAATANELGIPFAGHVPADVGVRAALDAGIATIDHLDGYMETLIPPDSDPTGGVGGFFGLLLAGVAEQSRIESIVAATSAAGTWNVPTQTLFEHTADAQAPESIAEWPEMRYVDAATVAGWVRVKNDLLADPQFDRQLADRAISLRRELIRQLHDSGAGILLGSDSPQRFNVPGFSLHRELELLVASGLSPYEALKTGTVSPAVFFGAGDERGSVDVGMVADLVLLDDNPLEDIGNSRRVHGTMVRGHWVSRQALDRLLAFAERR
ncbi:MAG: amidohydrolase family protein [Woeseiaceae bacterium]|nr:amidohydrolase family protein [Woeseiaceae bacterium]